MKMQFFHGGTSEGTHILQKMSYLFLLLLLLPRTHALARTEGRDEYPIVPWEDLWQELDDMTHGKEFCAPEDGLCLFNDTSLARSTKKPLNKFDLNVHCHCDDDCVRYGECCRDKAEADWGDGREEGSSRYSCRKMETLSSIGVFMLDSCMPGYEDKKVQDLCLQKVSDEAYTYELDLPVTSIDTNITYVNIHCAVCNKDAGNLHTWNVTINCSTREILKYFSMAEFMAEAEYFKGMRQWRRYTYRTAEDKAHKVYRRQYYCTLEVVEFQNRTAFIQNFGGRLCVYPKSTCNVSHNHNSPMCREMVRHCDPAWPDHLDRDKCQRYSNIVIYNDEIGRKRIYKNPHCARCNFVNVSSSDLVCFSPEERKELNKTRSRNFSRPPVFSVLMDFRSKECSNKDELWDPIHSKCRKIFCGYLYKLENGRCVRDETAFEMLKNTSVLDDECPKIPVHEYVFREDGSVFVNISKKKYDAESYGILNDTHILICNENHHYISKFSAAHVYLTIIVMVISIISLALHIVIYLLVPRCRNLPGMNLFSLVCCLFIAHLLYLTGTRATHYHWLCVSISAMLHYFWMASFCWMNVMSIDVCRTFTRVYRSDLNSRKNYVCYSLYAWGIPALVVIISLTFDFVDIAVDYRPEYGSDYCWINNLDGVVLFFLLPVGAIVIENVVLYFVTICCIRKQAKAASFAATRSQSVKEAHTSSESQKVKNYQDVSVKTATQSHRIKKDRIRLMLYVNLGIIQGLSWLLGLLAAIVDFPAIWYFFTLFNGLQGAFIFLGFDLKRKVWESVWEAITGKPWKKHQSSKTGTHTSSLPASTFSQSMSSKSSSDSDGENPLNTSIGHFVVGDGCQLLHFDEFPWMRSARASQPKTRHKHAPQTCSQRTSTTRPSGTVTDGQTSGSNSENSTKSRVRNGDLRGSVVKGKFADERSEDYAALSRARVEAAMKGSILVNKRKKSDIQRFIDLLQQLQQSKNSNNFHSVVQHVLAKSGASSNGKQQKHSSTPKCHPSVDSMMPILHDKKSVQASKLKAPSHDLHDSIAHPILSISSSKSAEETTVSRLPAASARIICRPKSLVSNAHDNASQQCLAQQQYSSMEKVATGSDQQRDVSRKPARPQSFTQVSNVALAAALLQRAATESRVQQRGISEEMPKHERSKTISSTNSKEKDCQFESLV